jgi:hypothetical protein
VGAHGKKSAFTGVHPAGRVQVYVYPPEPPLTIEERFVLCVMSRDARLATMGVTVGSESTTYVKIGLEIEYPLASVTVSLTLNVPDMVGVHTTERAAELPHPAGNPDQV